MLPLELLFFLNGKIQNVHFHVQLLGAQRENGAQKIEKKRVAGRHKASLYCFLFSVFSRCAQLTEPMEETTIKLYIAVLTSFN